MKYTYAYKSSDGTRHEAAIEAKSREEVFASLRTKGIKAIKVVAADGSKANGEVRGVRKRVVAALVVTAAVVVGIIAYVGGSRSKPQSVPRGLQQSSFLTDTTRRQVIGDAAIIEKGIRTGWADVFDHEGERFLASFAIPGVKAGVGSTSIDALEACLREEKPKVAAQATSLEARQIIAMVEGMKREARAYLAAGGTMVDYGKRLTERQDAEIAVFKRVEAEIQSAQKTMSESDFTEFYEQRNDELRNLGIRPVTLADQAGEQ